MINIILLEFEDYLTQPVFNKTPKRFGYPDVPYFIKC